MIFITFYEQVTALIQIRSAERNIHNILCAIKFTFIHNGCIIGAAKDGIIDIRSKVNLFHEYTETGITPTSLGFLLEIELHVTDCFAIHGSQLIGRHDKLTLVKILCIISIYGNILVIV